jgi:YHS domain-containing protein
MELDVVCGMEVAPIRTMQTEFAGRTFYFCSEECRQRFESAPHEYLAQHLEA